MLMLLKKKWESSFDHNNGDLLTTNNNNNLAGRNLSSSDPALNELEQAEIRAMQQRVGGVEELHYDGRDGELTFHYFLGSWL